MFLHLLLLGVLLPGEDINSAVVYRAGGMTLVPPPVEGGGVTYAQGPHVIGRVKIFWARADV